MFIFFYKNLLNGINLSDLILLFICNLLIINTINSYFMKNPIYSLILLIVNYSLGGLLFIYNGLAFIGMVFILIYVGAVSVLLVFTLMLLNLKTIYYKNESALNYYFLIAFVFIIEFISFYFCLKNYDISFFDYYLYTDWFKILFLKSDFVNIGYPLIIFNSEILIIVGLLLLVILVASVSMVITLKDSKKQEKYSQFKNYNKNVFN